MKPKYPKHKYKVGQRFKPNNFLLEKLYGHITIVRLDHHISGNRYIVKWDSGLDSGYDREVFHEESFIECFDSLAYVDTPLWEVLEGNRVPNSSSESLTGRRKPCKDEHE